MWVPWSWAATQGRPYRIADFTQIYSNLGKDEVMTTLLSL